MARRDKNEVWVFIACLQVKESVAAYFKHSYVEAETENDAYAKLTDATKIHATNVVEGKGSKTKTEYFKTKTDIATMLRKSANKEIKVTFEKKIKEEENEGKIFNFMKAFANGKKTVHVSKFDFKALAKIVSWRSESVTWLSCRRYSQYV